MLGIFPAFFSEILPSFGVSEFVFSFHKIQGMLSPCFLECWKVAMLVMFAGLPEYEHMGSISFNLHIQIYTHILCVIYT